MCQPRSPRQDSATSFPRIARKSERRLALADWIVHPDNPLTPRVLANRLWHYHFGTGIVDTPSDFGYMGGRPTHPELLDFLAIQAEGERLANQGDAPADHDFADVPAVVGVSRRRGEDRW